MTEPAIVTVLEDKLIEKHMKTVIEMEYSGDVYMLQNDNKQDLLSMFKLLKQVDNGVKSLCNSVSIYLHKQVNAFVEHKSLSSAVEYIQSLFDL